MIIIICVLQQLPVAHHYIWWRNKMNLFFSLNTIFYFIIFAAGFDTIMHAMSLFFTFLCGFFLLVAMQRSEKTNKTLFRGRVQIGAKISQKNTKLVTNWVYRTLAIRNGFTKLTINVQNCSLARWKSKRNRINMLRIKSCVQHFVVVYFLWNDSRFFFIRAIRSLVQSTLAHRTPNAEAMFLNTVKKWRVIIAGEKLLRCWNVKIFQLEIYKTMLFFHRP